MKIFENVKNKKQGGKTSKWEETFAEFVAKSETDENSPKVEQKASIDEVMAHITQKDHEALNVVLLEILSPQLHRNEAQKRLFKETLMRYIKNLIIAQLVLVAIPILLCCIAVCFKIPFMNVLEHQTINTIFEFLKYYITAVIAEFLMMLFFIVKFVFDKSIVDLMGKLLDK